MFINLHTHRFSNKKTFGILNAYTMETNLACSYGIHPWYINEYSEDIFRHLEKIVQNVNCYAIGECGLDRNKDIDWDKQVYWFEKHIELSEKYEKPLIIHCVKAIPELIWLKQKYKPKQAWIFHGFRKMSAANQVLHEGFYLSIGQPILNNISFQQKVATLPLERCFLETDDKVVLIEDIYAKLAEIKNIEVDELKQIMISNFEDVFKRTLLL